MSDISGGLGIKSSVALCLIGVRACVTIEEIAVVDPDVVVVLLESAVVALTAVAVHKAEISYLYVGAVLHNETEAVEGSVIAYALDGTACCDCVHHKVSLHENGRIGDIADEADIQRSWLLALLICGDYILHACHRRGSLSRGVDAC